MALAPNVAVLFIAMLGLRLTGQGLLSLAASTTMARVFTEGRGKALSVAGLGYPLGEGRLPMAIVLLIHATGWRLSWGILGGVIAVLLLPAMASLLREVEPLHQREIQAHHLSSDKRHLLRDRRFYWLLPGNLYLPVVLTALFLYQVPLAEHRGWTTESMATAFLGFAVARMAASLLVGPIIDRWGAIRLFPVILMPVCVGLAALSIGQSPWILFVYLTFAGVSQGIASPLMTALWAEVYGVETLGLTKSIVATFGIFATALGPALLGGLLAAGVSFGVIIPAAAGLGLLAVGVSLRARSLLLRRL
jgi:MFS family permease